jgi:hypothetical protein
MLAKGRPLFPPDFEVSYRFLTAEEGGRQNSLPLQGYRCPWAYEDDNVEGLALMWEILPEFEDAEGRIIPHLAPITATGTAKMYILDPKMRQEIHRERIHIGTKGFFMEGTKKVAEATVTNILNLNQE